MKPLLVLRADAGRQIGIGHVMRCIALGQAWQRVGGRVAFIAAHLGDLLAARLSAEDFELNVLGSESSLEQDAAYTAELASGPKSWLIVDGYQFDSTYQRQVKEGGCRLVSVDDTAHLPHYYADIVLNQNIGAEELRYVREDYTHLLLGPKYALLRKEFWPWKGCKRKIPSLARRLLLTLGGSDPHNITAGVIRALGRAGIQGSETVIAVGPENSQLEVLQEVARETAIPVRFETDAHNIPELMVWADLAISCAGSTCWELAFMGLPALVIVVADNQARIAERLERAGIALNLGWYTTLSPDRIAISLAMLASCPARRTEMAERGRQLVDGDGAALVVRALLAA